MELDKRIKSIDCIRSFNTNNDDCLGKFGYFTNYVTNFDDLNSIRKGICSFKDGSRFPFYCDDQKFQFFIPENELLPKEKKYRPYTLEEFCNEGFEIVVFRNKNDESLEYHVRYNGYIKSRVRHNGYRTCNDNLYIILGNVNYTLKQLFDDFEYLDDDGEWKPFGVEE